MPRAAERLFDHPRLYRTKQFFIETVLWRFVLSGLLRLDRRPFPDLRDEWRDSRVLLAACGPGDVSTGPPILDARHVTAFDRSDNFARACSRNCPEWSVYAGDLLALPHADRAFDVAVLYSALHHLDQHATSAIAELARVTSRRVIIVEGVIPERGLLRRLLLAWYRVVDGGTHYYTRNELAAAIKELGLRIASETRHGPIAHMLLLRIDTQHPPSR